MRAHWIIIFLVGVMILGTLVFSETYASHANVKIYTQMDLDVKGGSDPGQIQVYPALSLRSGQTLHSYDIVIRVDDVFKKIVRANEWSENIPFSFGSHTVKATFESADFGSDSYKRSYDSVSYTLTSTKSGTTKSTTAVTSSSIQTTLSLGMRDGTQEGTIQFFPRLEASSGEAVKNKNIKIIENNKIVKTVYTDTWSDDIYLGIGSHRITAEYTSPKSSIHTSATKTISYVIFSKSSSTSSTKSPHEEMITALSSGIKTAEDSLSGLSFENADARKKLDDAWKIRWMAIVSLDKAKVKSNLASLYLKSNEHQKSLVKASEIRQHADSIVDDLKSITKELKNAKKLEDDFQKPNQVCFLFWCFGGGSQNSGLDVRIKNLESQINTITNKESKLLPASKESTIGQQQKEVTEVEVDVITFDNVERQQAIAESLRQQAELEKERQRMEEEIRQQRSQTEYEQQRLEDEIRQQRSQIQKERQRMEEEVRQQRIQAEYEQLRLEEEIRQQQIQIQKERQRMEEEVRQQRIQAEYEQLRLEEEIRQQQIQAENERQRVEAQKQLESEKSKIRLLAKNSPLIKGLMNGGLSFYVQPMPPDASQNVRDYVEKLASWMDGNYFNGVKLKRVYSSSADFTINWVKDYQGETIGRQVKDYLIVGLGSSGCFGEWKPFDGFTVYKLMWHEIGHAMGQDHVSDPNNIMYKSIKNAKYEYDFSKTITLPDGDVWAQYFCNSGSVSFTTKGDSTKSGYKVYVIPSGTNYWDAIKGKTAFYTSCSAYKDKMISFSDSCNVERGSRLVLYNPTFLEYTGITLGRNLEVQVKMFDRNPAGDIDMSFRSDSRYWSQEYLNYVKDLFR